MSDRIPHKIRQDVIDVLLFIKPRMPMCPAEEQTYLFDIYNQYIKPTYMPDLEQGCGGCRSQVINRVKYAANSWNMHEETL